MVPVLNDLEDVHRQYSGCALTIGNFDGVHRGHQQILDQVRSLARSRPAPAVALTFDPHPLVLLRPRAVPEPLMPLAERVRCLGAAGAGVIVVARTNPALLAMSAESFVEQVVFERLAPAHLVEGESFGFGRGRRGGTELLRELAPRYGFEVSVVDPVQLDLPGEGRTAVSSSLVRRLVARGQVQPAALCLGRPYALLGVVGRGHGRGRDLGFPTINLTRLEQLLPGLGVYAGGAEVGGRRYHAAISVGSAATFGDGPVQVEAHLLDCSADLYGQPVRLEFLRHLRDQRLFAGPAEVRSQIEKDVLAVRHMAEYGSTS